jgi:hypothetical protein
MVSQFQLEAFGLEMYGGTREILQGMQTFVDSDPVVWPLPVNPSIVLVRQKF